MLEPVQPVNKNSRSFHLTVLNVITSFMLVNLELKTKLRLSIQTTLYMSIPTGSTLVQNVIMDTTGLNQTLLTLANVLSAINQLMIVWTVKLLTGVLNARITNSQVGTRQSAYLDLMIALLLHLNTS